jgi:hypothetical protein
MMGTEADAKARAFRARTIDPHIRMRVHIPAHATDVQRKEFLDLGVDTYLGDVT